MLKVGKPFMKVFFIEPGQKGCTFPRIREIYEESKECLPGNVS